MAETESFDCFCNLLALFLGNLKDFLGFSLPWMNLRSTITFPKPKKKDRQRFSTTKESKSDIMFVQKPFLLIATILEFSLNYLGRLLRLDKKKINGKYYANLFNE